jgi:transcriptional regulatory protein LevR
MDSEILERLEILHTSGQISEQDKDRTIKAINYLENKLKIKVEKEMGGMFATHLAKALSRIACSEAIEESSEEAEVAVREHPEILREAEILFEDTLGIKDVPKGEINFIAMYMNLLLNS